MRYWLMKSEPTTFSWDDLKKARNRTTSWEGVRNYQARNFMRDEFEAGDGVLFYHSNAEPPGIAGIAEVARKGYADPFALDSKSKYYDEDAAKKGTNPWVMVDIKAAMELSHFIDREEIKKTPALKNMWVLKRGSRLSVQPVTEAEFKAILRLGNAKKLSKWPTLMGN